MKRTYASANGAGFGILAATLLFTAPAFAQDCTPAVPDSALVKPGTLIMSTNPTIPPMQFVDSTGASSVGTLFAMATLAIAPVVGFFLASQRLLTQGIATTGIK